MNLFKKLFNDPAPITWHDPNAGQAKVGTQPLPPTTEEDRKQTHQLIDQVLAHNPEAAQRAHLMTDIAADLTPWIQESELNHVMAGLRNVPTDTLTKMNDKLHAKETTYKEKASLKKLLLAQGYMIHAKKQMRRQYIVQPILITAMYASMYVGIYGMLKQNDRTVMTGIIALAACYYIDHEVSKNFKRAMKDQKEFFDILRRDPEQLIGLENERLKWVQNKNTNSK